MILQGWLRASVQLTIRNKIPAAIGEPLFTPWPSFEEYFCLSKAKATGVSDQCKRTFSAVDDILTQCI